MSNLFSTVVNGSQFNFQPYELADSTSYHVDVKDEEGTRWEFRMTKSEEQWKLEGEKLPTWIHDAAQDLGKAIDDHD